MVFIIPVTFNCFVVNRYKVILLLILFQFADYLVGQNWPKVYITNDGNYPFSVIEHYDKGYLVGGWFVSSDGFPINGLLMKTNLNGDMLWRKRFGMNNDGTGILDINKTFDGGIILAGHTGKYDSWGDPLVVKLNFCCELEWCRIYTIGNNRADVASAIEQIPGGYIVYVFYGYDLWSNNKIHLYRLDSDGDLVWQQLYGQSDSLILGADGEDMRVTPDYNYLISGICYYPDSGSTNPKYLRPIHIMADSTGSVVWERPWSVINGVSFRGEAYRSILDNQNNIYSCGRHIESSATPPGDRPTMLKTDASGNEISYHDLVPDSWGGNFFNINWFQDSTIEIDGGWSMTPSLDGPVAVFRIDRNGNILDSATIVNSIYGFSDAVVDHDNKVFLVKGEYIGNQFRTYAWKLNSDLEYDTLYTHPFVYDSLCPHPIASDTIPLDCEVVGLDEPFNNPETGRLKVYPNPATDILHIEIPEKLKTETSTPAFNITTVYHQWKSATVEVFDLFGRRVFSKEITQSDKELCIDVSSWHAGMYVVRLVYLGRTAGSEKIIVQ
jgi:hypothetical protein